MASDSGRICHVISGLRLLLLFSPVFAVHAEKCTTGFSVVAPEVAVPGKPTAVLVTLHSVDVGSSEITINQPVNVTLRLEGPINGEVGESLLVSTSKMVSGHGIVTLKIPSTASGHFTLHTLVNCTTEQQDCPLRSHSLLRLLGPVRDIIIRPARHLYKPGDTITFWVLALDHDLHLAKEVLGSLALKDPFGTKVAVWDQVALDEGVKKFTIHLSERATPGRWSIHAETTVDPSTAISSAATVELNVSRVGWGKSGSELAAAEQHYVELHFGSEMKRQYKPGLPFAGKVEAMSTERLIRVRVKIFEGKTTIYSQDIDISTGEGAFSVPIMYSDHDTVLMQAELVAVEGKEIESHYVLAREILHKWNSSSECYMLIEGLQMPLQPGETAHVSIASTCPCTNSVQATVTTAGRATYWAERKISTLPTTIIHYDKPVGETTVSASICKFNYSFPIHAEMAPISQLLVYYLTDSGEPVSDVTSFQVRLLHREVSVALEERKFWYPRQPLGVKILAEPGSSVCIIGGKPAADNKFDSHNSVNQYHSSSLQSELDFLTAGVSLFQRRCSSSTDDSVLYRQRGAGGGPAKGAPKESLVGGDINDRLWMWKCFNYSSQLSTEGITISTPSEAGRWSVWALSLSPRTGLRFSKAKTMTVFRPLQVDFSTPPSLKVGETVEIDVKIGNNINSCMDVTTLLGLSSGAKFVSNGMTYVTEKMRLGPHGATSLVVRVAVETAGLKNITVEVTGFGAEDCSISNPSFSNETLVGSVIRSANIIVRPEGLLKRDTESAYFCANEHMVISTSDEFVYEWVSAPRNRAGLVLEARARGALHVALSPMNENHPAMYRIVLNDQGKSWIARGKHGYGVHLVSVESNGIVNEDAFRTFWVSWEKGILAIGRGPIIKNDTIMTWRMDNKAKIKNVGFASSWGELAEFRIWNFNDEAGFSQVLELSLPHGVVPGSAQGTLLIAGGLVLPHLSQATVPSMLWHSGNTATSMSAATAPFAPLLAMEHTPHLINVSHHENILKQLPGQVQTLLAFRKSDNSFCDHHSMSSHLGTVHILEVLSKIQSYFPIDPDLLQTVKRWVQMRQEPEGGFSPLPADMKIAIMSNEIDNKTPVYNDLEYGFIERWRNLSRENMELERKIEVTAETLATLLEIGVESEMDELVIEKSRKFLEEHMEKVTSSLPLSAMVYGLVLSRSSKIPEGLERLNNVSTTEEGEFGWPHPMPRRDAADWLYEEDSGRQLKAPVLTNVEDYKASVNALLVYTLLGDLKNAESVARYLYYRSHILDKHAELLYHSVKAFSMFSALAYDRHRALTVSLATAGMELTDTLELKANSLPKKLQLPELPTKVFVYATGAGCATIQGSITYSTYVPLSENALLSINSAVIEEIRSSDQRGGPDEIQGNLPALNLKTCFQWKHHNRSGVLRLEVSLFSGYELSSVNPVVVDGGSFADMQHGHNGDFAWFVFANVSSMCPICVNYQAHSNFVVSTLRPAFAKVYPATRPDLAVEIFFHSRQGSLLMKGITDDDKITWFGKINNNNYDYDLSDICECGRVCHKELSTNTSMNIIVVNNNNVVNEQYKNVNIESTVIQKNTEYVHFPQESNNDKETEDIPNSINMINGNLPDIPLIVPEYAMPGKSKYDSKIDTRLSNKTDEIIIQNGDIKPKSNFISKKTESSRKPIRPKKQQLPRKKGTLKHTYGEFHEMVVQPTTVISTIDSLNIEPKTTNIPSFVESDPKTGAITTNILSSRTHTTEIDSNTTFMPSSTENDINVETNNTILKSSTEINPTFEPNTTNYTFIPSENINVKTSTNTHELSTMLTTVSTNKTDSNVAGFAEDNEFSKYNNLNKINNIRQRSVDGTFKAVADITTMNPKSQSKLSMVAVTYSADKSTEGSMSSKNVNQNKQKSNGIVNKSDSELATFDSPLLVDNSLVVVTTPIVGLFQNMISSNNKNKYDNINQGTINGAIEIGTEITTINPTFITENSSVAATTAPVKHVNKEINNPPLAPYSETTSKILSEESKHKFVPDSKTEYLVLNRNELWGLLKEVVHAEMEKKPKKLNISNIIKTILSKDEESTN